MFAQLRNRGGYHEYSADLEDLNSGPEFLALRETAQLFYPSVFVSVSETESRGLSSFPVWPPNCLPGSKHAINWRKKTPLP